MIVANSGAVKLSAVATAVQHATAAADQPWRHQRHSPEKPERRRFQRADLVGHRPHQRMVAGQTRRPGDHGQDGDQRARQAEHSVARLGHVEVVVVMRLAASASRRAI